MTVTEPTYRRPLNTEQLAVLRWLYSVRFSTSKQIAKHLKKPNHKAIQNKLQILEARRYISKHYDASYRLQGRPAEYFLTPLGGRQLAPDDRNESATKAIYKNKTVSADFISHCLTVADTALLLKAIYGDTIKIFSRYALTEYSYFPTWPPDLFLSLKNPDGKKVRRYFLDIWDGTQPFFVGVRKARNYITYATDGDWPCEHGDLPIVLMICPDEQTQKKLNRQIHRAVEEADMWNEIIFVTITREELETAAVTSKPWHKVNEDNEYRRIGL
jgi:hypothetical protein